MGNIKTIVQNAATSIASKITNAHAYDYAPDSVNQFPAIIVLMDPLNSEIAFGGNSFEGTLRVICLTEKAEGREAWLRIYDYMDSTGSGTSVIAAIRADPTLGASVDSCDIVRVENIGQRLINQQPYVGFDVLVPFIKSVP